MKWRRMSSKEWSEGKVLVVLCGEGELGGAQVRRGHDGINSATVS